MRAVLPIEHDGVRGLVAVGIIVEPSTDAAPEKTRRIGHGYAASDLGRARHGRRRGTGAVAVGLVAVTALRVAAAGFGAFGWTLGGESRKSPAADSRGLA